MVILLHQKLILEMLKTDVLSELPLSNHGPSLWPPLAPSGPLFSLVSLPKAIANPGGADTRQRFAFPWNHNVSTSRDVIE